MARAIIITSFLISLIGLVIAWPLVRAAVEFRTVRGDILDVIISPGEHGLVQVTIAYEYPLPTKPERAIGYTLANERLQAGPDPQMDAARAESLKRALTGRSARVYYDVNHPYDSAFMLNPVNPKGGLRAEHGALIVLVGLAFGIVGQLARQRR